MSNWERWLALPAVVGVAFLATCLGAAFVAELAGVWNEPVAGFAAAIAVVVSAYCMAPRWKVLVACVAFGIGAWAAVRLLQDSYYPEDHPRGYEPTRWPLVITLSGGLLALAAVVLVELWRRARVRSADHGVN